MRFGGADNLDIDSTQRIAEGQNLQIRETLWRYESVVEQHRREVYGMRREILLSPDWSVASILPEELYLELKEAVDTDTLEAAGRRLVLAVLDDLWADYLANIAELRGGIHWVSWGGRDPLHAFLTTANQIYDNFHKNLDEEVLNAFDTAEIRDGQILFQNEEKFERGATWTYLTTDQPFGTLGERIIKGLRQKFRRPS